MLTQETFRVGLRMLEACFNIQPDKNTQQIWFRLLSKNAEDKEFIDAITVLCEQEAKLYPSDNPVAIILDKIKAMKEQAFIEQERKRQQLEQLEYKKHIALHMNRSEEETEKTLAKIEEMKKRIGLNFRKPILIENKSA